MLHIKFKNYNCHSTYNSKRINNYDIRIIVISDDDDNNSNGNDKTNYNPKFGYQVT